MNDESNSEQEKNGNNGIKPPIVVRFWHSLRRRRVWLRIGEHPKPNIAEKTTVFITFCILVVGGIQAYIYWRQSQTMQNSLAQNERSIILGQGQLAVANRNVASAEQGGKDTHELAVQAKNQADRMADQLPELRKSADAAATAANTATQSLVAGQRPWLGPEGNPTIILTSTANGVKIQTGLVMKVTGAPPALNVDYFMMARAYEEVSNNAKEISDNYCGMAELKPSLTDKTNLGSLGVPVFGTATIVDPDPNILPKDQHVAVIGCIAYVDQFHLSLHSPIHHTRFCFYMPTSIGEVMGQSPKINYAGPFYECLIGLGAD